MKIVNVRFVEIFTNGAINFSYKGLKISKQVGFYEKDSKNSLFYKKPTKKQLSQNLSQNSYKSKYKF